LDVSTGLSMDLGICTDLSICRHTQHTHPHTQTNTHTHTHFFFCFFFFVFFLQAVVRPAVPTRDMAPPSDRRGMRAGGFLRWALSPDDDERHERDGRGDRKRETKKGKRGGSDTEAFRQNRRPRCTPRPDAVGTHPGHHNRVAKSLVTTAETNEPSPRNLPGHRNRVAKSLETWGGGNV
jgi:hypothetical protein